jgi:hypothetical protein
MPVSPSLPEINAASCVPEIKAPEEKKGSQRSSAPRALKASSLIRLFTDWGIELSAKRKKKKKINMRK